MLRRILNIASIVCLVLCVALMGMWVRSYQSVDELVGHLSSKLVFTVNSRSGRLLVILRTWGDHRPWTIESHRLNDEFPSDFPTEGGGIFEHVGFKIDFYPSAPTMVLPYWFVVLTSGFLAIAIRIRWPRRYTLRSLFIVTTFLAIVLGMIAWLDRAWIGK